MDKALEEKFEVVWENLLPKIDILEKERLEKFKIYSKSIPFVIISCIGILLCGIYYNSAETSEQTLAIILFVILFITAGISMYICFSIYSGFKRKIKSQLFPEILSMFGDFKRYEKEVITSKVIKDTGLFPRFTTKWDDDNIAGVYNNKAIYICETRLSHTESRGKSSTTVTDFDGLIIKTAISKNYSGKTVICNKGGSFRQGDLQNIQLEDPEFNKRFDVYSDDQVEARYIVTTAFMDRLKNISNVIQSYETYCVIENNYITLFLETQKDFFEVGEIYKPINNKNRYIEVYRQLSSIFELIHYFKLDKKLGL